MTIRHAAVWIDHNEAKVFHVDAEQLESKTIHAHTHHIGRHQKGGLEDRGHPADLQRYFHEVAGVLKQVEEILVVGPGKAKLEFFKHLHKHDHEIEPHVVGLETVDHPTDGQLVAFARKYFLAHDRMNPIEL